MHLILRLLVVSAVFPSLVAAQPFPDKADAEAERPSIRGRTARPSDAGKPPVFVSSAGSDCRSRRESYERQLDFKRRKMIWNVLKIAGVGASYGLEACREAQRAFDKAAELSDGARSRRAFESASAKAFQGASACRRAFEQLYVSDCGRASDAACRTADAERREAAYLDEQNARFAKDLEARHQRLAQLARCKDGPAEAARDGGRDEQPWNAGPAKPATFAAAGPGGAVPPIVAPGSRGAARGLDRNAPPPAAAPPPRTSWWDRLKGALEGAAKDVAKANLRFGKGLFDGAKKLWDGLFGKAKQPEKKPEKKPEKPPVIPSQYLVSDPVDKATATVGLEEQKVRSHQFRGAKVEAEVWDARYSDGTDIEIVGPKGYAEGRKNYSIGQVAEAVRYLPSSSRAVVERVQLNPVTNPDDEYWAKEYNTPDFRSYMTAGAEGVITIYPAEDGELLVSEGDMRVSLIHETGHTWSYRRWGSDKDGGKWKDWKKAGTADNTWVSRYAQSSPAEDIAETYAAYWSTMDKPKSKVYRKAVPNRFAMLDRETK